MYMKLFGYSVVDIIIVCIMLNFMLTACRIGLIKSLLSFCSLIFSLILSNQLYPSIAEFIRKNTKLFDILDRSIRNIIDISHSINPPALNLQDDITSTINNLDLPKPISDFLSSNANSLTIGINDMQLFDVDKAMNFVADNLSNLLIKLLAMVIAFTAISIVFGIIIHIVDIISYFPIIFIFNKLGGLILGFFEGVLFLWLCFTILTLFFPAKSGFIHNMLSSSVLAPKFYNGNLILKYFISFLH